MLDPAMLLRQMTFGKEYRDAEHRSWILLDCLGTIKEGKEAYYLAVEEGSLMPATVVLLQAPTGLHLNPKDQQHEL